MPSTQRGQGLTARPPPLGPALRDAVDLDVEVALASRVRLIKEHSERLGALRGEDEWDVVLGEVVTDWPSVNDAGTVLIRWSDAERIHR
jgi:hypothetical protein